VRVLLDRDFSFGVLATEQANQKKGVARKDEFIEEFYPEPARISHQDIASILGRGAPNWGVAVCSLSAGCGVYTTAMAKLTLLFNTLLAMTVCGPSTAQQSAPPSPGPQDLQPGVVVPKVSCATQPEQSYALYLPSHYSREKRWPIVYAFDPAARGSMPVELMKDAAERYGYIVAGSNNSHNGAWKPEADAAQAMFQDTHARLGIDNNRVYFAGFSGGARLASSLAQRCHCAAGVLLNGAGFSPSAPPAADATFYVFAAVGTFDFNYSEVVDLDAKLGVLRYSHALQRFDGPHQWAPANVMDEALAWFRLMSMKQGHEERDTDFVKAQASEAEKRAKNLELAGDPYGSWKEYRQAAETFDGLGEAPAFRERAVTMEREKVVRDGAKREQQDFEEQSRLSANISAGLAALRQDATNRADIRSDLERQISELRSRAEHEKNPQKLRVAKRALAGIFVEAMETGQERLDTKDVSHARTCFELAAIADPDSVWALGQVAIARALDGDRKGALEAIRRTKEKSKDPSAFSSWLNEEPAFTKLRDNPEFRALLAAPSHPQ
jgi:dienelactone hydrolase